MEINEIYRESRQISVSATSFTRRLAFQICMSEDEYNEIVPIAYTEPDFVFNLNDDIYVLSFCSETFPDLIEVEGYSGDTITLGLASVELSQVGDFNWKVTLEYTLPDKLDQDYVQLSFSLSANQVNRKQSIAVRNSASRTGYFAATPPNPYRAIGYSDGNIEGASAYTPSLSFQLTKYFDPTLWVSGLIGTWKALQFTYNNDVFYGQAAGEVLFMGAQGQGAQFTKIPVTFDFIASPNINGVADEGFPVLYALGHDIIDYTFNELYDPTTGHTVRYPTFRYVHQMYFPADHSLLGV